MNDDLLITIDGPGATGKSSVAYTVACDLGLNYLNSGALYRIAASYVVNDQYHIDDIQGIVNQLNKDEVKFKQTKDSPRLIILMNNVDITDQLAHESIGQMASKLSLSSLLRQSIVRKQQSYFKAPGLIADGRDMGSCIFPEAKFKFFLTASAKIRAQRRYKQLQDQGINANFTEVLDSLLKRDEQDTTRTVAPLVIPRGSVVIDTSDMEFSDVVDKVKMSCGMNEWC